VPSKRLDNVAGFFRVAVPEVDVGIPAVGANIRQASDSRNTESTSGGGWLPVDLSCMRTGIASLNM
jgi:hypothetical protein